jgi:hypothetical protein
MLTICRDVGVNSSQLLKILLLLINLLFLLRLTVAAVEPVELVGNSPALGLCDKVWKTCAELMGNVVFVVHKFCKQSVKFSMPYPSAPGELSIKSTGFPILSFPLVQFSFFIDPLTLPINRIIDRW